MSRRVAVIGAGLSGICTAFELARLGCQVTVFERQGSVAEQASFAGSALTASPLPGLATLPRGPLRPLGWRWQRWRAERRPLNPPSLTALAAHSLAHLAALRREFKIDDEAGAQLLVLLGSKRSTAAAERQLEAWRADGTGITLIDPAAARRREPGLATEAPLEAALELSPGGSGNARLLAQALRTQAQRLGVEFRFHTAVRAIEPGQPARLQHEHVAPAAWSRARREAGDTVPTPLGPQQQDFDAIVVCAGLAGRSLLQSAGLRLPLAALHEASVTLPLRVLEAHPELGPQGALFDLERGLSIARIGQRIRVAGERSISAADTADPRIDFERLHRGLQAWFPGAGQHQQAQQWQTRRALLPDALPLIGAGGPPGLWLHLQTGLDGWGLTPGAAEVLAQQITGGKPAVDLAGLDASRLA